MIFIERGVVSNRRARRTLTDAADPPAVAPAPAASVGSAAATVSGLTVPDPPGMPAPAHNTIGVDYAAGLPPPPVAGGIVDCHTHLFAADHAPAWFAAADRFGVAHCLTMTPLEEAVRLLGGPFGGRVTLIHVPSWHPAMPDPASMYRADPFRRRLDAFHNLGSRVVKIHQSPSQLAKHGMPIGSDRHLRLLGLIRASGSVIMSHIGDPAAWYAGKYADDPATFGRRGTHYAAWERCLEAMRGTPWWGAHLGGRPDDLGYLDGLLARFPDLWLDLSATTWVVRELGRQPAAARAFVVRHQDRLMFGSDQVSLDLETWRGRCADFFASRWWVHRTLWETRHDGPSPIRDPAAPGGSARLAGLDLPPAVLAKLYRGNITRLMASVGVTIP